MDYLKLLQNSYETEQRINDCPPEPAGNHGIDTLYVLHTEKMRWGDVVQHAEYSLEQQMESDGSGNLERPWGEMKVTITGVLLTPEEWEEISGNEY